MTAPVSATRCAPLVQALRGRGGTALIERIRQHPLAPAADGLHRYQLASILATGKPSKWRAAAEAVARDLGLVE